MNEKSAEREGEGHAWFAVWSSPHDARRQGGYNEEGKGVRSTRDEGEVDNS